MKPEELLELFSEADDDLLRRSETATLPQKRRTPLRLSQWGMVACYFLISVALFFTALHFSDTVPSDAPSPGDSSVSATDTTPADTSTAPDHPTVDLSQYTPATVSEVSAEQVEQVDASVNRMQASLVTEKVFWTDPHLLLFRGTVLSLRHLKIDCGQTRLREDFVKDCVLYSIVFTVKIGEVYHGDVEFGDEISVYMTYIGEFGISEWANQVYGFLVPGVEGIFGVRPTQEDSYYTSDDHIFYYNSVAQSITTGFIMIETDGSVCFPFPYYRNNVFTSLDDGAGYLRRRLEQYCS